MLRSDTFEVPRPRQELGTWRPDASDWNPRATIALLEEARRVGLCVTCDHAPTCFYRHRQLDPVLYCEEFA